MSTVTGRLIDYGNNYDFRSALETKLNAKKSELGETELSLKKFVGNRLANNLQGGIEAKDDRLSSFKGRLGPVVSGRGARNSQPTNERRVSIGSRLGPRVSESVDDDDGSNGTGGANGFGGEVTGRGSVMSRIVVEQKSREDALAEQKLDKKETQRNKRMFGSILGTLQRFRADESKDKDRDLKKRKIEAKIDQKSEKEKEEAIRQKKELFEDKKKKEREIKVLQVQMKRAEEFETWERNKRKEQKYIRTRNCSRKIYFLPKQHNDATLTALENTMDEIDEEIQAARELFEEELLKINARADQNPNASLEDLEGDDNSGEENDEDISATKSIVSAVILPHNDEAKIRGRKSVGADDDTILSIKKEKKHVSNGSMEHSDVNGKINDESEDSLYPKREKKESLGLLDHADYDKSEERPLENALKAENTLDGGAKVKSEKENGVHKVNEDTENYNDSKVKHEAMHDEPQNKESLSLDTSYIDKSLNKATNSVTKNSEKIRDRSKSPKSEKIKRRRSSSTREEHSRSKIKREETGGTSNEKLLSKTKPGSFKKSKAGRKRRSSSEESSSSNSSDDSNSDNRSSGTTSTSENSDSSENSSDGHNSKKKRNKAKVQKNKESLNKKGHRKESPSNKKSHNGKKKVQKSRKDRNKNDSDSSDTN